MDWSQLPHAIQKKKLAHLKERRAQGVPVHSFSQHERDLLHMETSEENLQYWRNENQIANSDERCRHCQSIARSIVIALRALEVSADDEHPLAHILNGALEEADRLSPVH